MTAKTRLTDKVCRDAVPSDSGARSAIIWDSDVPGFGLRVTRRNGSDAEATGGVKAFILNYRVRGGKQRQYTIGRWGSDYKQASAARARAIELRRQVAEGGDPQRDLDEYRAAETVADLCDRYLKEHARTKRSASEDQSIINQIILPALGTHKVRDIEFADIERLHRRISEVGFDVPAKGNFPGRAGRPAPIRANRTIEVLRKAMNLAIRWQMRDSNPCVGIAKNAEHQRRRYLSDDELARLVAELERRADHPSVAAIKLALLTGARRGELLAAKWADIDLKAGKWSKPASTTKQRKVHEVPLSTEAQQLLADLAAKATTEWVFPSPDGTTRQKELRRTWRSVCVAAGIAGLRFHDLRHSYASFLINAGLGLPVVGELLGHSQMSTTQRYAHIADAVTRAATAKVGALVGAVAKGKPAEVIDLGKREARG